MESSWCATNAKRKVDGEAKDAKRKDEQMSKRGDTTTHTSSLGSKDDSSGSEDKIVITRSWYKKCKSENWSKTRYLQTNLDKEWKRLEKKNQGKREKEEKKQRRFL